MFLVAARATKLRNATVQSRAVSGGSETPSTSAPPNTPWPGSWSIPLGAGDAGLSHPRQRKELNLGLLPHLALVGALQP